MTEALIPILLHTLSANGARGTKRVELQQLISEELDKLRILLRLSKDLRFISIKQYIYAAEKVNEMGKILSGWMKKPMINTNRVEKDDGNMPLF